MRIGAANKLACVAWCRAAWATKREAENLDISATDAPAWIAEANE
jgi:hypothetical protein